MTNIIIQYKDKKKTLRVNTNGSLSVTSLKKYFPQADGLIYKDQRGKVHTLTVSSGKILINSDIKEYSLYVGEENQQENDLQPHVTQTAERSNKPGDLLVNCKTILSKSKTLRVGWMHKSPTDKKYCKLKKPLRGLVKLKLDEALAYTADEIKTMAVKEIEKTENFVMEEKFVISLGFFNGSIIKDFILDKELICDIWTYCKFKKITLYNLNIFLLTTSKNPLEDPFSQLKSIQDFKPVLNNVSKKTVVKKRKKRVPKTPRIEDDFRIYYHYIKTSKYSKELSYTECEKQNLHAYFLDDNFGDGPVIEDFKPCEYGYNYCRIEKGEKVYFHVNLDENSKRSFEFPSAELPVKPHSIVHDTDELRGIYDAKYGIGVIPSCTDTCHPIFTWYKDGIIYKKGEFLYWMSDLEITMDEDKHVWHCVITCSESNSELRSKDVLLDNRFC